MVPSSVMSLKIVAQIHAKKTSPAPHLRLCQTLPLSLSLSLSLSHALLPLSLSFPLYIPPSFFPPSCLLSLSPLSLSLSFLPFLLIRHLRVFRSLALPSSPSCCHALSLQCCKCSGVCKCATVHAGVSCKNTHPWSLTTCKLRCWTSA